MKILIHISLLLIIPFGLVSQNSRDLSSTDQRNLYQGIIYSKRNDCYKANEYLNLFILNYNGTDKDYWLLKAKSYVLPCNEMTILNEPLDYFHRPKYNLKDTELSPSHNHNEEEYVAPDIAIILDIYRNTFDLITSLSPEVKYPLIDVNDLPENVDEDAIVEDHNHNDEEWVSPDYDIIKDIYRNTFDLVKALDPEAFYPLIEADSEIPTDVELSIWPPVDYSTDETVATDILIWSSPRQTKAKTDKDILIWSTSDYDKQVRIAKSTTTMWPHDPDTANKDMSKSKEYTAALKRFLNQRKSKSEDKSTNTEVTSSKEKNVINENNNNSISKKIKHYRILFTIDKSPDKAFITLSSYGPVTSTQSKSGYYAYYVGYTQDKKKAEKLLLKVQKSGYKVAEIVEFSEDTKGDRNKK